MMLAYVLTASIWSIYGPGSIDFSRSSSGPSASNPVMGENGAFWAGTGALVITQLTPSGK